MNLTEALNVALPEIPARTKRLSYPRLHPKLVGRERVEGGRSIVTCIISGKNSLYFFPPFQWQLLQLFNGERTYEEVSDLFFEETGTRYEPEELRKMAEDLDAVDFWYRTPFEQNIALKQKLKEERENRAKKRSKYGDVSKLEFSTWDPDQYLTHLHQRIRFVYSWWFTLLTLCGFAFMAYVFVVRWEEIGRDTLQFYNFTEKGFADIAEFWLLAAFVLFFHETGHGLSCKHFGGGVHRMGFTLIYFTPAFFTDVTEAWVYANKWQRIATVISGAWTEMIICAIATPIWWGTPYGTWLHDAAYKLILITGLGVIFFNYNPLIKLDGYYLLTEFLELPDLKEDSTAYTAALVKKYLWRLPVEVPYVPKRRRVGYVIYALVSGLYSYALLFFFARFIGNIFRHFTPEWAFLPAMLVGLRLFKSRILTLVNFMKTVYLDKKEHVAAWFTPQRRWATSAGLVVLLLIPWFHESVEGRFLLEPAQLAVLRATAAGKVVSMPAAEGQRVSRGQTIATLQNFSLESEAARTTADLRIADARAREAELRYSDYGPAARERLRLEQRDSDLRQEMGSLNVVSPIEGEVLTARPRDLLGAFVAEGTELIQVGAVDTMRARIFIPEYAVRKVALGAGVNLHFDSYFSSRPGWVESLAPASSEIAAGLIPETSYKGIRPPVFFVADILVSNANEKLRPGMAGTARVYGPRTSLAGMMWQQVYDFIRRKVW